MKLLAVVLSAGIALACCAEANAARKHKPKYQSTNTTQTRSTTTAANGLCLRDTGKPTSELNFRNRCDVEEFWTRMQEKSDNMR